jgi:hypothetical protein
MSSQKGLLTTEAFDEWAEIEADVEKVEQYQHLCNQKEPDLFLGFWEEYIRKILNIMVRELAPSVALNPGCIRSLEKVIERVLLMGYFFGQRRFEVSLKTMEPSLGIEVPKSEPHHDNGGFNSKDFQV